MNLDLWKQMEDARSSSALENMNPGAASDSDTIVEGLQHNEPEPASDHQARAIQPDEPESASGNHAEGTECNTESEDPMESANDDPALACDDFNISLHTEA
jgi:hypothetical protein